MGYNAVKKAYDSMHLAKYILAAELICDGQALDCYEDKRCAKGTQAIYDLLRSKVPEMDNDMPLRHISEPSPSRSSTARISEPWKQASAR